MLILLLGAAAAPPNSVPDVVAGLSGCWTARGQVRGKDAASVVRGEWHLGRRYFTLHLHSVPPVAPYEAAITFGAGEKLGQIGSFWMDTFGGLYEPSLGLGTVAADGFSLDYRFPDAVYRNRFVRKVHRWNWTIVEQAPGKPAKLFAQYDLTARNCAHVRFSF
jgi:hypothetical protein